MRSDCCGHKRLITRPQILAIDWFGTPLPPYWRRPSSGTPNGSALVQAALADASSVIAQVEAADRAFAAEATAAVGRRNGRVSLAVAG